MNASLADIVKYLTASREILYCYVVATVSNDQGLYRQEGSGPNFQGDVITLCTCKHSLRALWDAPAWQGKWIAGVTGQNATWDRHYLVYLIQVGKAYNSQADIYKALSPAAQRAKAADANRLGDLYRPKEVIRDVYNANNYMRPIDGHTHCVHDGWREDIGYTDQYGRRCAYLAGAPGRSFLWNRPEIVVRITLARGHKRFEPARDFVHNLSEP